MSNANPADIRAARQRADLTQAQAADLINVDRVSWARYENGTYPLDAIRWRYWCHVAGLQRIPFAKAR